jgi:hypothetical protein
VNFSVSKLVLDLKIGRHVVHDWYSHIGDGNPRAGELSRVVFEQDQANHDSDTATPGTGNKDDKPVARQRKYADARHMKPGAGKECGGITF